LTNKTVAVLFCISRYGYIGIWLLKRFKHHDIKSVMYMYAGLIFLNYGIVYSTIEKI